MKRINTVVICILQFTLVAVATAQVKTVYASISGSAKLLCESASKPLAEGIIRIGWYITEDTSDVNNRITQHIFSTDTVYPDSDYSEDKYVYSKSDYSLTIMNVGYTDEIRYTCYQTANNAQTFVNEVVVLVRPDIPNFILLPTFQDNATGSVQCKVASVKPAVGSIQFTVRIDPDVIVESSDNDLTEVEVDSVTGAVSVTYTTEITLQRKYNGQDTVCEMEWRGESFTSETQQADVRFKPSQVTMSGVPTDLVLENTDMTVVCRTDEGNPSPTVRWYRDGQAVPVDTDLETVIDTETDGVQYNGKVRMSSLEIQVDSTLNGKMYRCEVEDTSLKESFQLDVAYVHPPLRLSGNPSSSSPVSEGQSVEFTCTLDANPQPGFSIWRSEDGTQEKWKDLSEGQNTIILSLQRQHNIVGLKCRADGTLEGYPLVSTLKTYTVQFSASSIMLTQFPSDPVLENTTVTLVCVTNEAEPTADVEWTVGGKSMSSTSDSTEEGHYNAQTRRSLLELRMDRTYNNKEVVCFIRGKSEVRDTVTLDVTYETTSMVTPTTTDDITAITGSKTPDDITAITEPTTPESNAGFGIRPAVLLVNSIVSVLTTRSLCNNSRE